MLSRAGETEENKDDTSITPSSIPPLSGTISSVVIQLQPTTKNKQKNSAIPKTNTFFMITFIVLEFIKHFLLLALNITSDGSLSHFNPSGKFLGIFILDK